MTSEVAGRKKIIVNAVTFSSNDLSLLTISISGRGLNINEKNHMETKNTFSNILKLETIKRSEHSFLTISEFPIIIKLRKIQTKVSAKICNLWKYRNSLVHFVPKYKISQIEKLLAVLTINYDY